MGYHILLSFIPFVLIFILSLSLFAALSKLLKDESFFLLLSVFLATPLLVGLFLYLLFFIFPEHTNHFYILAISSPILLFSFLERKSIFLTFHTIYARWKILKTTPLDLFSKIILAAILFALTLIFLRTVLWPINWDDQIYYVKQAYIFSQTRSLNLFFEWGFYRDSQIYTTQMNPAIRPGLPMIFTTTFFFNNSLSDAIFFCQSIIFYYFLITTSAIFYTIWRIAKAEKLKHALVALFFTLFTYHFTYLSVSGFKELLIIPPVILMLFLISKQNSPTNIKPWIYIGIMTGLISFVNYSGTLLTFFIISIFIFSEKISLEKAMLAGKILLLTILFGGFELLAFSSFIMPNFSTIFPQITSTKKEKVATNKIITDNQDSKSIQSIDSFSSEAKKEFVKYNITSFKDLYLKGKFQGIFQIQYFGLIFILFIAILIFRFEDLKNNNFIKYILSFLLLYVFIFFDPLNINRSRFAYVLSISHKYTTLLVPFVAIIIAYQLDWMQEIFKKISLNSLSLTIFSFFIFDYIFIKNNPDKLLGAASIFLPMINSKEYYVQKITSLNNLYLIVSSIFLGIFICAYMINKKRLHLLFKETPIIIMLFIFICFALPFLFFYNSNFGLINTFTYSFSKTSTKLEKIKGWEKKYHPLKELNALPKDKKILLIDQPIKLIDIYLHLPIDNIYRKSDLQKQSIDAIRELGIDYIYAKNNSRLNDLELNKMDELVLKKQIDDNTILEIKS